jgi:acyl-CoA dehydrogenase
MKSTFCPPILVETPELRQLRHEVRSFLAGQIEAGRFTPGVDTWIAHWDADFTKDLAGHGWIGMTIPHEYGGHGRTFMERFVVLEELLAAGAPVAAHWVADRQIVPSLLRFGSEEQKRRYLPRIASGECAFAIGMSEPDSGSDLASVRTRAVRVDGGWRITGTKVWTSGAHHAEAFFALARTARLDLNARHAGLSQFILDLRSEGIEIRPIISMSGQHHFNEVFLDEVFVPDAMVLGEIGSGWAQVTSELAYERSGPERFLSTFRLYAELAQRARDTRALASADLGRITGRLRALHQLSMAISGALERGENADTSAAVVKVLGTTLEGDIVEEAHLLTGAPRPEEAGDAEFRSLLQSSLLQRPGFTLRGGTNEILRGVIAKGVGLR